MKTVTIASAVALLVIAASLPASARHTAEERNAQDRTKETRDATAADQAARSLGMERDGQGGWRFWSTSGDRGNAKQSGSLNCCSSSQGGNRNGGGSENGNND